MNKLYKWDRKELLKKRNNIIRDFKNEDDCIEQILMNEYYLRAIIDILKINQLNFNLLNKYPYFFLSNKNLAKTIKEVVKSFSTKYQKDIIEHSIKHVKTNNQELDFSSLINKSIPFEKQFQLIKKNFSNTKELINAHNKLFDPNNHLLNITKKFGGDAFWNVKDEGYISNINNLSIFDFMTLCHEVGHYDEFIITGGLIDKKINAHKKIKLYNYIEVYSIFYELLSTLILKENGYINSYETLQLLDEIKNSNTYNIEYFLLAKDYTYKNKDININPIRFLSNELNDISMYYYSYLIANELFNQYLDDKEKAFYNLNYLINNITPNNERKILKYCDIDLYNLSDKNNLKKA